MSILIPQVELSLRAHSLGTAFVYNFVLTADLSLPCGTVFWLTERQFTCSSSFTTYTPSHRRHHGCKLVRLFSMEYAARGMCRSV
jgi:hypothetical protein